MSWGEHSNDSLLPLAPCFGWAGAVAGTWEHQLLGSTRATHAKTRTASHAGERGRCLDINCRGWPGHPHRAEGTTQDLLDLLALCLGGWRLGGICQALKRASACENLHLSLSSLRRGVLRNHGERANPHREHTCWFSLMYSPLKPLNALWFPLFFPPNKWAIYAGFFLWHSILELLAA